MEVMFDWTGPAVKRSQSGPFWLAGGKRPNRQRWPS